MDFLSELSKNVPLASPVFKLADYKEKINTKENWTSSPFLAFDEGYQLCLKVYPAGIGEGAGSYVSVEIYLMKGPYDDKLQRSGHWPLKGNFSVQLLIPQHLDGESSYMQFASKINAHIQFEINDIKEIPRITHNDMVKVGSIDQFMSCDYALSSGVGSSGNLYFRVLYNEDKLTYTDTYTLSKQLNTHKLYLQHALVPLYMRYSNKELNDQVAPAILQLSRFSTLTTGDTWYSSPLFAFIGGYQVCLKVERVKACLMSAEVFLMKGPHDEKLQELGLWPVKGTFTLKVFGNNDYYPRVYAPPDEERCTKCFEQVTVDDIASEGFGFSLFTLDSSCTEPNFFKDDTLFFEVLYNKGTAAL